MNHYLNLLAVVSTLTFAGPSTSQTINDPWDLDFDTGGTQNNVIFITLDGVRLHEFLNTPDSNFSNGDLAPTFP